MRKYFSFVLIFLVISLSTYIAVNVITLPYSAVLTLEQLPSDFEKTINMISPYLYGK